LLMSCFLLAACVLLHAQNILTPKWVANGWSAPNEHPKFSADGSRAIVWGTVPSSSGYENTIFGWAVYNVSDSRVLAHFTIDGNNGILTGVALSPDGGTVYYGTTAGIFAYTISTHTQVLLPNTGASANNGAMYLDVTSDGSTLGYVLTNPTNKDSLVYAYSLTSQSIVHHFQMSNSATSNQTNALKFIANGTEVVLSGPTIYTVAGTQLFAGTNSISDVAVSPDGSMVFVDPNGNGVYAYSTSSYTTLWGPVNSPGFMDSGSVTSDGQALLFTSTGTMQWIVSGLSTATGSTIPNLTIPVTIVGSSPFIAAIPNSNQILVGPGTYGYYGSEASSQVWTYASGTGVGSFVGAFFEGYIEYGNPSIVGIGANVSGQLVQELADTEYHTSANLLAIRSASTGTILSTQIPLGAAVSPNGQYYVLVSGDGLGVYNVSDGSYIDSTTIANTNLAYAQWGGNGTIAVSGNDPYDGSVNGPYVFTFDGSFLSTTYQAFEFNNAIFRLSPDGTKIAAIMNSNTYGSGVLLYDVASGNQISGISPISNSSEIDSITFSQTNLLGVHDTLTTNGYGSVPAQAVEYRVFNVSTATPALIQTILYPTTVNVSASGGGLSPDGQTVAVGHVSSSIATDPRQQGSVRLYSVSSGALLNQWDTQFVPYFNFYYDAFAFASDSSTVLWATDNAIVAAPIVPFQMILTLDPSAVFGGTGSTGTMTVNPAQPADTTFTLSSSSTNVSVPATVTIPAGKTSATFAITTQPLSSGQIVPITATYNGATATANLTLNPYTVASLSLNPTTVPGGTSSTGTVTIGQTPGPAGATVTLSVTGTDAQVPATVLIPGGSTSATFAITTNGVANNETVTVAAAIGTSVQKASLTINAPTFSSLSVSPTSVVGGTSATGTITLIGDAPKSGVVIGLTSNNASATVPQSITVASGTNTATFTINTLGVTSAAKAIITGNYIGSTTTTTLTATLTVQVPPLLGVTVSPTSSVGGSQTKVTGTVTLGGIGATAGDVITLTSSNASAASVPSSVTVPSGATTATFVVTTAAVTTSQTVTITASFIGTSKNTTLTLTPFTVTGLTLNPTTVLGGSPSTGTVTISQAPAGNPVTVNLSVSGSVAKVPATVLIPVGATSATFTVTTSAVTSSQNVTVTAAIGSSQQTATLTLIGAALTSVTVSPSTVIGGAASTGTVTISQSAPTGGIAVGLSSSSASATVPQSVTVPSGATSATFSVTSTAVATTTAATITATLNSTSKTATLTVQAPPLLSVSVSPTSCVGGSQTKITGTVTLGGAAVSAGDVITLTSSNTAAATVPSSVTVAGGATTATFVVTTLAVTTAQNVTITATFNGVNKTAVLAVTPFTVSSLSLNPTSVWGGSSSTGTVTIGQASANAPVTVNLSVSGSSAQAPSTVSVPAGSTTATFTVNTSAVSSPQTVTITAAIGASQQTATLTVNGASLSSIAVSPTSVAGGSPSTGTATITQTAPTGGVVVSLSSSSPNATLPASVTIAAGSKTATFNIKTSGVLTTTSAIITGNLGSSSQTATLTIQPATIQSLTVSPTTVVGGSQTAVTGTVSLSGIAASIGDIVSLTSSNPAAASVPSSATVTGSSGSATFAVTTYSVTSSQAVTLTATFNGISKTASLTVNPYQIGALTLSPTSVYGGNSSSGTVTISQAAGTSGVTVNLSSSGADAKVPTSVTIPSGASSANFTVGTNGVGKSEAITIAASIGSNSKSAVLTLLPATLTSLSLSPSTVVGGNSSTGTLTLNGYAPAAGLTVTLSSSNAAASVPSSVTVPGGANGGTFAIATHGVTAAVSATISASLSGSTTQTAVLTVQPPALTGLVLTSTSVVGGSQTTLSGTVTLSGAAATAGDRVTLKSSNTKVATVPAYVTVTSGESSATFSVTHLLVSSAGTTTITATFNGVTESAVLTVNPFQLASLAVSPTTVYGTVSSTGTATLNAVPGSKSGPITVKLASSSKSATVPASVTVAVGASMGQFTVKTTSVTATTSATITGTYLTSSQQASLTIQPLPVLNSVTVNPSSVVGSSTTVVTGTITVSGPAPAGGLVVKLSSSNTAAATVPASVTIAAGNTSATFAVGHKKVTATKNVTITATLNGKTGVTTLTVQTG